MCCFIKWGMIGHWFKITVKKHRKGMGNEKKTIQKSCKRNLAALMTLSTPLSDWSNLTAYAKTNVVETSTALELAT